MAKLPPLVVIGSTHQMVVAKAKISGIAGTNSAGGTGVGVRLNSTTGPVLASLAAGALSDLFYFIPLSIDVDEGTLVYNTGNDQATIYFD